MRGAGTPARQHAEPARRSAGVPALPMIRNDKRQIPSFQHGLDSFQHALLPTLAPAASPRAAGEPAKHRLSAAALEALPATPALAPAPRAAGEPSAAAARAATPTRGRAAVPAPPAPLGPRAPASPR
jgi:hypothetical protein